MSSGFVSGGTTDAPIERDSAWLAAELELETSRRVAAAAIAANSNGRSLFETLEANKVHKLITQPTPEAAKQDAFEEASKLKNQFRSLDADEIEFLDSVLESTRAEEERVKRETRAGLELFRKQQEIQDKKRLESEGSEGRLNTEAAEEWSSAAGASLRKRKRKGGREALGLKGVKIRRESTGSAGIEVKLAKSADEANLAVHAHVIPEKELGGAAVIVSKQKEYLNPIAAQTTKPVPTVAAPKKGLALVDYGSDEDND